MSHKATNKPTTGRLGVAEHAVEKDAGYGFFKDHKNNVFATVVTLNLSTSWPEISRPFS
jgi:hypothetical protein